MGRPRFQSRPEDPGRSQPAVRLPTVDPDAPPVGYLELFYDLVFVAATMVLSNTFAANATWEGAGVCTLVFALVWLLWFHTTNLANVDRVDDMAHRALVLVQMLLISMTTIAFADKEVSDGDFVGLAYGAAVAVVALMHHRCSRSTPEAAQWARQRRNHLGVAGLLLVSTTFLPDGIDAVVFVVAIVVLLVPSSLGSRRHARRPPIDVHHLTERAALLTLIMCGEAFLKVSLTVTAGSISRTDVEAMIIEFLVVFSIFWAYFDDVPRAGIRPGAVLGELWVLVHLPLQVGIVGVAIGVSKFLQVTGGGVHDTVIVILGVGFLLVYGGLAAVGQLGMRRPRAPLTTLRLGSAAVVVVWGVSAWAADLQPVWYLVGLTVVALAHSGVANRLRRATVVLAAPTDHGHDGRR